MAACPAGHPFVPFHEGETPRPPSEQDEKEGTRHSVQNDTRETKDEGKYGGLPGRTSDRSLHRRENPVSVRDGHLAYRLKKIKKPCNVEKNGVYYKKGEM